MIARPPATETPVRRRLSASARRAAILRAAIVCFGARGFDATSMDDIAAAAGISKPVLYDHFASKDVLYLALLESLRDRLLAAGAASFATAASIEAGVARAIGDFVAFVAAEPDAARLLFQSPAGEGPRVDAARRIQAEASAALASVLETRAAATQSTEHALAIEFLKAGLHAVALWWAGHPEISPERLTAMLATLGWSGLSGLLDLD